MCHSIRLIWARIKRGRSGMAHDRFKTFLGPKKKEISKQVLKSAPKHPQPHEKSIVVQQRCHGCVATAQPRAFAPSFLHFLDICRSEVSAKAPPLEQPALDELHRFPLLSSSHVYVILDFILLMAVNFKNFSRVTLHLLLPACKCSHFCRMSLA